jgi:hypothetical protein
LLIPRKRAHSRQKRREFASPSRIFRADFAACFRPIGFELPRRRQRGLQGSWRRLGIVGNQSEESAMTKLLAISAFVGVAYLFDPSYAGSFDTQMRVLAYKFNSALDVRPYLGGR